jgi:hypothetical protein
VPIFWVSSRFAQEPSMSRSSHLVAAGAAIVALAAGAFVGWPRPARADAPAGAELGTTRSGPATRAEPVAVAGPVVLETPVPFAVGHRLQVELPARTHARRDLLRVEAEFRTADGAAVVVVPVVARLTGGDWRTVPFGLDVPDGAASVELRWSATVGPIEVGTPTVVAVSSSAAPGPDDH